MRAAVLSSIGQPLELWDMQNMPLGPTEVRVRIGATGVCRSDHHRVSGAIPIQLPVILGHEACGIVVEVGERVRGFESGDRVVSSPNPECGQCWFCVNGQPNLCATIGVLRARPAARRSDGQVIGSLAGLGTFREEMNVDETMLVKVETSLPDEQLALLGCAVITGVGAVLNTARVTVGSTVAIIGCGGVGLASVQGCRIAAAGRILAIDPVRSKREAAIVLGATDAIDPTAVDPIEAVRAASGGRGADFAFDMVGGAPTILLARQLTRRGGTTILVGAAAVGETVTFSAWDLHTEGRILGCSNGSAHIRRDIPRLVQLAEKGVLDLGSLVTHRGRLEDIDAAFTAMETGQSIRTVVVPASGGGA